MPRARARRAASMSQTLSPTTTARLDRHAEPFGGGEEEVGVGLGVVHLVAGDDRGVGRIDAQRCERGPRAVSIRPLVAMAQGIAGSVS